MNDTKKREIFRLLQNKGFGLPQIHCADFLLNDEINHKLHIDSIEVCENCSLGSISKCEKVVGQGPITSPLMIIGDNPSDYDAVDNILFSNAGGYFLTMALQVLNVDRRAIYCTNVVKCNAMNTLGPDEMACCKPFIEYELDRIKPKVIIALGNSAIKSLTNHSEINISKIRGGYFIKGDTRIYTTWHPDYVLMKQGVDYIKTRDEFIYDLQQAIDYVKSICSAYRWIL